ncbi:3-keto-steroid reductase [Diatrype stigma]|uniref:3-keto-steroid reductase n=1 Tax=Diatrype stigma TaxID=117547 RepID=A0AAN9YQJ6_9PEZI
MASPPPPQPPPPLPWAAAASHEQYFVLLTGANSGVGLGIGQRIIDDFLATRSPTSHLILIPTTRSVQKSCDAIRALRAHLETSARTKFARTNPGANNPQAATMTDRVHILSVELDLCDLRSVYAAADRLLGRGGGGGGVLRDPTGRVRGSAELTIPRLDAAIFNAGIGGWKGVNWPLLVRQMLAVGPCQATTFPAFKDALVPAAVLDREKLLPGGGGGGGGDGGAANQKTEKGAPLPTELAEVFCANVFGHYVLAHELMPLLGRPPRGSGSGGGDYDGSSAVPPGRVIWTSSIDAGEEHLDFEDFQARDHQPPYESSKRITDVIALTSELPSVRPVSAPYFSLEPSPSSSSSSSEKKEEGAWQPPRFYLSHPGIVCTPLFPLGWFLYFWYNLAMYVVRWLGSPWHVVEPYLGAQASAWLALADPAELDARAAARVKWGSACYRFSDDQSAGPKETEVEGWGWDGRVGQQQKGGAAAAGEEGGAGYLSRASGRKWDAVPLTEERKARFEDAGRRCWAELEKLRREWEVALGRR